MTDAAVQARVASVSLLAQRICDRMNEEIAKLGLPADRMAVVAHTDAEYRLHRDPASGEDSLIGVWRNKAGHKRGELLFHADGSFFAEYDVVQVHPDKPRWFIEAVSAWGRGSLIKSELRLLPVAS